MPGLVSCLFVPVCSAPLWRLSAVKPPLTLVAPRHCADRILHTPLCTPCRPPAGTFTHWHIQRTTARNTQTYAAAHTYATRPSVVEHMMDGPMRDHFTSERPPLPLPFFLLPQSGYCVHIQTRYWVKCYLFARAVDIYRLPDMSSENQYRSWSFS